ncbi:helix-turn-helix transcriptional regulator [Nonomuraea fuscirosea]|uniref:helix-turn-helix transcriptional regulator n=1 Tax=Nonomuraea fuscirosea TaxID=1291556 RepID=UPI003412A124
MFVGRTEELAFLRAELRAAGAGSPRRVVVEGPEGIGKTALIHHALDGEAGARVLTVSGEEGEQGFPLGVVRQLVAEAARLGGRAPAGAAVAGGRGPAGVAATGWGFAGPADTEPGGVVPGPSGAGPRGAGVSPCAAGEVVCDLVGRLAERGLLAVVVDDAQWADQPSLRALGYALRRVAGRVLVLVVCRDLGGTRLPEGLRRLLTGDDTVRLTLNGLNAADLAAMAASAVSRAGSRSVSRAGSAPAALPISAVSGGGSAFAASATGAVSAASPATAGSVAQPVLVADPVSAAGPVPSVGAVTDASALLDARVASVARHVEEPVTPVRSQAGLGACRTDADDAAREGQAGGGGGLGETAVGRLWEHTRGNPLHARALLKSLSPAALRDPWGRWPAPETYRRIFARRVRFCAPETRRLVAACAVLGEECSLHVAVGVAKEGGRPLDAAETGKSLDALEEAVGAGLLRELPGRRVGFPEPLARAAAYDGVGAGTRARLHLAASRVSEDSGAALRHRAAAAGGPDEPLAEELAGYAAKAAQHGLWQEAAAHLDLAAGLTESAACDELRTAVLEHVLIGGDVLRAAELAAVRNADPRPVRRYVLGRLALAAGRFDEASELLAEAWRHAEPGFAADVAEQLAWLRLVTGDRAAAAGWARLAIEQPIQGMAARPYDVLALGGAPCAGAPPGGLAAAVTLLARDEPGQARAMLGRAAGAAAPAHHRLLATALLAVAEHACARWDKAAAHAEHAFAQATALGQRWLLPFLEAACVAPLAALGEHVRALTHATEAAATARRMGHVMGERQAALAMALLTPGEVPPAAHLPPAPSAASGMNGVPGASGAGGGDREWSGGLDVFVPDPRPARIEALVADGRLEEAERALAAFDREGTRYDGEEAYVGGDGPRYDGQGARQSGEEGQWGGEGGRGDGDEAWRGSEEARRGEARRRAERARLGGLLLAGRNAPAQAEEAFLRALSLAAAGVCPLEEARVLLDLGRLLRRTGRRKAAAERLGAARAIFERLGARPLAERCGKELEACGMEPPATARLGLTPQELSTATLVAGGLTNRQIARELLISVKTVEYHIGKIYTKLGISSRVALAAKLAA